MLGRGGVWTSALGGGGGGVADNKYIRTTRYVSIGAGTSGTVTLPSNSAVVLDDFGGTVDAVVLQIASGLPLKAPALTSLGSVVAATFDASGNWTFSAAPVAYPVALVYRVQQLIADFDDTSADIWGDAESFGAQTGNIAFTIDGGGDVIATGTQNFVVVPYDCVITSARIFADQSGSCVIDIWKDTYANFPPTIADTITASAKPTLSSAQKNQDTTLTGWTTTLTAGDILYYNVDSATTVTKVLVVLGVRRA